MLMLVLKPLIKECAKYVTQILIKEPEKQTN